MEDKDDLVNSFKVTVSADVIRVDFLVRVIDPGQNVERAQLAVDEVYHILDEHPEETFKVLVDMSTMGESKIPTKAHKVYLSALKRSQIKKVAVVGDFKKQLKVLAFLMPFIVGEGKKITWFPNVAEAKLWLEN